MGDKIKISIPDGDGTINDTIGENMEILDVKEPWAEYVLENGAKIRAKQTIINIVKLDKKNPDGTDIYIMQGQPVMYVIAKV